MSMDPHSIVSESTFLPTIELPRTLERPPATSDSISRLGLDAIAPELVDVPLPYIHHQIALQTERMLVGLRDLPLPRALPRLRLQEFLPIAEADLPSHDGEPPIYPTHVLAVSLPSESILTGTSTYASEQDAMLTLVPIHGIVFAANCASQILRPVPQPEPTTDKGDADPLILPVCPVCLPSVDALLVLRTYMYTKRVDALFADSIPLFDDNDDHELPAHKTADLKSESPPSSADTRALHLATRLARRPGFTLTHILKCASGVLDVWKTAWCIGLEVQHHTEFWDTVDLAWEVMILTLNLVGAENSS
ncbi:Clp1-like protein [Mycena sanguinolenta]|uniref:Clp1-like protein n=1 Tax=Mycena sanguinolenta TaxID=230812 RepID=A0A8H6YX40_9AGAR|nr:Clp1-like protein [Mycena sanguinolenta]